MKIQKATKEDADGLAELVSKVISTCPYYSLKAKQDEIKAHSTERIIPRLENKNVFYLIAKDRNRVVGFIYGSVKVGLLELVWLGVDKDYRKKGIARQLVRKAEEFGKRKKAHKSWCDTRTNNRESIALFKKLKYKKIATFKKHYWGLDFFIWEKLL